MDIEFSSLGKPHRLGWVPTGRASFTLTHYSVVPTKVRRMAELSKREFAKLRHAQRRELFKACRAGAKGTRWRSNQGVLFAQDTGWFLSVQEMTDILRERTRARISIKPMAIDPIFWRLIGYPELCEQPLSFRAYGWMKCALWNLEEIEVPEDGGVEQIARRLLEHGDRALDDIAAHWSADDFLRRINDSDKPDQWFVTRVTTLLADRRYDEARSLCENSAERRLSGGFLSSSRGTFNEMVIRMIDEQRAVENHGL
jgi:hypothetical protein